MVAPKARRERNSRRAAVVLPAPGLPVSTTFKQPSSSRGSPPACTYDTCHKRAVSKGEEGLSMLSAMGQLPYSEGRRRWSENSPLYYQREANLRHSEGGGGGGRRGGVRRRGA